MSARWPHLLELASSVLRSLWSLEAMCSGPLEWLYLPCLAHLDRLRVTTVCEPENMSRRCTSLLNLRWGAGEIISLAVKHEP